MSRKSSAPYTTTYRQRQRGRNKTRCYTLPLTDADIELALQHGWITEADLDAGQKVVATALAESLKVVLRKTTENIQKGISPGSRYGR